MNQNTAPLNTDTPQHNCAWCNKWALDTELSFQTINGWTAYWHRSCAWTAKREAEAA